MVNVLRASPWFGGTERDEQPSGDAALVAAARRNPDEFAALYRRYAVPVYRYCLRRLGDPDTAEDAMSLIFSRVFANLRHCDENAFRPWLFTIAHNVVIDRIRATRPSTPLDDAGDLLDDAPGPEHLAIAADERQTLAALLAHLTPDQRQVVELRLGGLTGVEIAATVGRSHDAVKKLQARALVKLRDLMGVASSDESR
jgi:RNA polymerase sigma-70 factor, ECF subfamily